MKSLTESPAILTVHEGTRGQYILRVSDLRHRPLVVQVTKLLSEAESFVIVTPTDIKVYEVNGDAPAIDDGPPVTDPEIAEQEPEPLTKPRKRARPAQVAGHDEQCGRCSGKGQVAVMLEGGTPAESACPVCKGEGVMRRYGARR